MCSARANARCQDEYGGLQPMKREARPKITKNNQKAEPHLERHLNSLASGDAEQDTARHAQGLHERLQLRGVAAPHVAPI